MLQRDPGESGNTWSAKFYFASERNFQQMCGRNGASKTLLQQNYVVDWCVETSEKLVGQAFLPVKKFENELKMTDRNVYPIDN